MKRQPSQLHEYQLEAIHRGIHWKEYALFLPVGKGKTVTTLTILTELLDRFEICGALVVAPKRVCETVWRQEAQQWEHLDHLRFSLVRGGPTERLEMLRKPAEIFLINYENLSWLLTTLFAKKTYKWKEEGRQKQKTLWEPRQPLPFDTLVFDELSSLANAQAIRSEAVLEMNKSGHIHRRIGLTATPATNGLMKLFGEYKALDMGKRFGPSQERFRHRYFWSPSPNKWSPFNGAKEHMFNVTKDMTFTVDDDATPDPTIIDHWVELPSDAQAKYEEMERAFYVELEAGAVEAFNATSKTGKCLQIANGHIYHNIPEPVIKEDGSVYQPPPSWSRVHNAKYSKIVELIEQMQGEPVVVVWNYKPDRDCLKQLLQEDFAVKEVTEYARAEKLLDDWNNRRIEVLLGHPASMGHGLNLQHASFQMIWLGLTWNLEHYDQTIGRLNRQGQKHQVMVHRILAGGTMDEVVKDALADKAQTQEDYLDLLRQHRPQETFGGEHRRTGETIPGSQPGVATLG